MLIRSGAYERFRARNAARVVSYRPVSPSVAWSRARASARTSRRILPLGSRALVGPIGTDSAQSRPPDQVGGEDPGAEVGLGGEQGEGLAGGRLDDVHLGPAARPRDRLLHRPGDVVDGQHVAALAGRVPALEGRRHHLGGRRGQHPLGLVGEQPVGLGQLGAGAALGGPEPGLLEACLDRLAAQVVEEAGGRLALGVVDPGGAQHHPRVVGLQRPFLGVDRDQGDLGLVAASRRPRGRRRCRGCSPRPTSRPGARPRRSRGSGPPGRPAGGWPGRSRACRRPGRGPARGRG